MGVGEIITQIRLGKGNKDEVICSGKEDGTLVYLSKRKNLKRTSSKDHVFKASLEEKAENSQGAHERHD